MTKYLDKYRKGSTKLNWNKVEAIRNSKGKITQRELADIYGVSRVTIARVQNNVTWKINGNQ